MNKTDFEKIDDRLQKITAQSVEEIEIYSDVPPTIDALEDNNKTYSIFAAILFIDIRGSTYLTENSQAKSMVKIYRTFMRMAVDCVRKNKGVTRQFLGDRIMGVFIDSKDGEENAADKAINAARSLQTVIDFSLNKYLKRYVNGKQIECGIGIDYGKVLVTQVGMYGLEQDSGRENEVGCVWVGKTTNYASKYSDIASGGEIFISENVYKKMAEKYKTGWSQLAKCKGTNIFTGYSINDYYLDFADELGVSNKPEQDKMACVETSQQLALMINEFEKLQKSMIDREKEILIFEVDLKENNEELVRQKDKAIHNEEKAIIEKKEIVVKYNEVVDEFFEFCAAIIKMSFCRKYEYINKFDLDEWLRIEKIFRKLVEIKQYNNDKISSSGFYFIDIFAYYEKWNLSYKYMLEMAEVNNIWVHINEQTYKWACEQDRGYDLIYIMKRNIENDKIIEEHKEDYLSRIEKLEKIWITKMS